MDNNSLIYLSNETTESRQDVWRKRSMQYVLVDAQTQVDNLLGKVSNAGQLGYLASNPNSLVVSKSDFTLAASVNVTNLLPAAPSSLLCNDLVVKPVAVNDPGDANKNFLPLDLSPQYAAVSNATSRLLLQSGSECGLVASASRALDTSWAATLVTKEPTLIGTAFNPDSGKWSRFVGASIDADTFKLTSSSPILDGIMAPGSHYAGAIDGLKAASLSVNMRDMLSASGSSILIGNELNSLSALLTNNGMDKLTVSQPLSVLDEKCRLTAKSSQLLGITIDSRASLTLGAIGKSPEPSTFWVRESSRNFASGLYAYPSHADHALVVSHAPHQATWAHQPSVRGYALDTVPDRNRYHVAKTSTLYTVTVDDPEMASLLQSALQNGNLSKQMLLDMTGYAEKMMEVMLEKAQEKITSYWESFFNSMGAKLMAKILDERLGKFLPDRTIATQSGSGKMKQETEQRGIKLGTPQRVTEFHRLVKSGQSYRQAKERAHCDPSTYYRWCKEVTGEEPITPYR